MTTTTTTTGARRIAHADAARLASHAYTRMLDLLTSLDVQDWSRPTDCTGWDVSDVVGHLIGGAKGHASLRELARQVRYGRAHRGEFGGSDMDAMNDLQVRDHAHLSPAERIAALEAIAPAAVRHRVRTPGPVGRLPIRIPVGVGSLPDALPRWITLRHLNDVVLTRDVLMHRIDIARAADRDPALDATDGEVVADVVAGWADAHGRPFSLVLDGPAGGTYRRGTGGEEIHTDPVTFCRTVAGRAEGTALLATPVLF